MNKPILNVETNLTRYRPHLFRGGARGLEGLFQLVSPLDLQVKLVL